MKHFPFLLFGLVSISVFGAELTPGGVPNFHQVDDHVFRGAQPTQEGIKNLAKLGVKTIVDLRDGENQRSMDEANWVKAAGMHYVHVPLHGFGAPGAGDVAKLLALLNDSNAGPVFVHCKRGADRTGTVIACYRMTHDHWENTKALLEAKTDGMSRLERAMQHYILTFNNAALSPASAAANAPAMIAAPKN